MKIQGTLKYKGYTGSIEYSIEDMCFYGRLLEINNLVMYEGSTIEDLEESFKYMVDDYLETCKGIGERTVNYSGL